MTEPSGGLPAAYEGDTSASQVEPHQADMTGLEDFDASDLVMPRIKLIHKEGVFQDGLTGEKMNEINVIGLGLVKHRVLWEPDVEDSGGPLCKSNDHQLGFPDDDRFPWGESKFDPNAYPVGAALPCSKCALKEWGTDPRKPGNDGPPWCAEQYTLVVLMLDENGGMPAPALLTFQRSAVKPTKAYLSSFVRQRTPLFAYETKIGLNVQSRGSVDYATPVFTRGESTDERFWPEWADSFRTIRGVITAPPRADEDGDTVTVEGGAPAAAPATEATPPAPAAPEPAAPASRGRGRGESAPSGRGRSAPAASSAPADSDEPPF